MAKREAENELTDRNWDREDRDGDDDGEAEGAFKTAPAAVLAGRQIRGMPKKRTATPSASPSPAPETAVPAVRSNPFATTSFSSLAALPSTTPSPTSNPFSFLASTTAPSPFPAFTPAATPSFSFTAPSSAPAPLTASPSSSSDVLLEYYKSIRALNLTFVASITQIVNETPFVQFGGGKEGSMSALLQRYDELFNGIEAQKNAASKTVVVVEKKTDVPMVLEEKKQNVEVKKVDEEKKMELPTPPAMFTFAGQVMKPTTATTTTATTAGNGYVPWTPATTSTSTSGSNGGFAFPTGVKVPGSSNVVEEKLAKEREVVAAAVAVAAATKEKEEKIEEERRKAAAAAADKERTMKKPAFVRGTTPIQPSPLRFGESVVESSEASSTSTSVSPPIPVSVPVPVVEKKPFSFGNSFGAIAKGGEKKEMASSSTSLYPAVPDFSTAQPTPTPATTTSAPVMSFPAPVPIASSSSAISTPNSFATGGFGMSASPPSFGFGAGLSANPSTSKMPLASGGAGFGFGLGSTTTAATNSIPNFTTTGFSFGGASAASGSSSSIPASSFSFNPIATNTTPSLFGTFTPPPASTAIVSTPTVTESEGDTPSDATSENPLAGDGAGEEDEITLHEVNGRVFILGTAGTDNLGIARIRIKERKDDGSRRILARNTVNGKILINFRLTNSSLPPLVVEKTFITFVGYEGTKNVMYRIRVKDVEQVTALRKVMEESQ